MRLHEDMKELEVFVKFSAHLNKTHNKNNWCNEIKLFIDSARVLWIITRLVFDMRLKRLKNLARDAFVITNGNTIEAKSGREPRTLCFAAENEAEPELILLCIV